MITAESLWELRDVAAFLKMSPSFIYKATSAGTLPCIRIGSRLKFDPDAIRAWAAGEHGAKVLQLPGCRTPSKR